MSAPVAIKVSERFEGTRRVLEADGWEWVTSEEFGDDEPRISDKNLAPRMGLPLNKVRQLSERYESARHIDPKKVYPAVGETGGRPSCQRFYTEADALFLVTRSDKAEAIQLTKGMIQVVIAVRRHLAATVAVRAHDRALPAAKTPESRQLPPPPDAVLRLRDLPNWPMLRHIAETTAPQRIDSRYYDLAGEFAVPRNTPTYPAVIADLAFFVLRHTPPLLLSAR